VPRVLRPLLLLAALLLGGLAPGLSARNVETRVGIFLANYDADASGDSAQSDAAQWEKLGCAYESASGRQHWSKFDPEGLSVGDQDSGPVMKMIGWVASFFLPDNVPQVGASRPLPKTEEEHEARQQERATVQGVVKRTNESLAKIAKVEDTVIKSTPILGPVVSGMELTTGKNMMGQPIDRAGAATDLAAGFAVNKAVAVGGVVVAKSASMVATEVKMMIQDLKVVKQIAAPGKFDAEASSLGHALELAKKAFPNGEHVPSAIPGIPYPKPADSKGPWFQVHPPEKLVDSWHVKYEDWTGGKKDSGGSWGHILFPDPSK
jgi:hypothetical protein